MFDFCGSKYIPLEHISQANALRNQRGNHISHNTCGLQSYVDEHEVILDEKVRKTAILK